MTKQLAISAVPLALLAVACGSQSDAGLFSSSVRGSGASAQVSSGGGSSPVDYTGQGGGGAGGALTGEDSGAMETGRGGGAGGASGSGEPGNGGSAEAGGTAGAGGSAPADAGTKLASCDFSGTWASYVTQPVTWPASIVLFAGQGTIQQWNLTRQKLIPGTATFDAKTIPCGLVVPDLQSNFFQANAKFGLRFPDALFDQGGIPDAPFVIRATATGGKLGFETDPFAILIGVNLADAAKASWPAATALTPRDDDEDGNVGITVAAAAGPGYSNFPGSSNPFDPVRADYVYIAERTVSSLLGTVDDCDHQHASVTVQAIGGKSGIDSTVIGCHKTDGTTCSAADAAFIDSNRPTFTPSGPGAMTIVRVPDAATCADVRARFPAR